MEVTTTGLRPSNNNPQLAPGNDTGNLGSSHNPSQNGQLDSLDTIGQPESRSDPIPSGSNLGDLTTSERQQQACDYSTADLKPHFPTDQEESTDTKNTFEANTPAFRQFVFRDAASASVSSSCQVTSVKGRTGPLSPGSRDRTKSVKEAGGACWRCKFCGKGCDPGDPCSSCPQKSTPWHILGCRRGALSEVLTPVNICPQAGVDFRSTLLPATIEEEAIVKSVNDCNLGIVREREESILKVESFHGDPVEHIGQKPQGGASRNKSLHHTLLATIWEIEHSCSMIGGVKLCIPSLKDQSNSGLSDLLSSAANYQINTANDQLIETSLFCLLSVLEIVRAQDEGELRLFEHVTCKPSRCKIDSYQKLKSHLDDYLNMLSKVIFKKNAKLRKDWWLSVFYSLCIQSIVRRALVFVTSKLRNLTDPDPRSAASQYLHLAVQLFFAACNAAGKGFEPLSYDFDNLSALEITNLTRHSFQIEHGKTAQKALQRNSWQRQNISSAYDYLGMLFEMDRAIFAPPVSRPPLYRAPFWDDELETVVDGGFGPFAKKRRVCKDPSVSTGGDSLLAQLPDALIIHPGSLARLHFTDEQPPPENPENESIRENEVRLEGDMFTPRWVRGFREEEEGWCGFCSRWLRVGAVWRNDRSLFHGICAETGRSFEEPTEAVKINHLKQIWKARCNICGVWVTYRKSDRKHYSAWYVHASNCGDESVMVETGEGTDGGM